MRIVIDTNLLVSGVVFSGLPRRLLNHAQAGNIELCTSEVLLTELHEVLGREKFAKRLTEASLSAARVVDDLRRIAWVVTPITVPPVVLTDPDDDHVLAAAVTAAADIIASGDKRDLLALGSYAGIAILTARQTLERIER